MRVLRPPIVRGVAAVRRAFRRGRVAADGARRPLSAGVERPGNPLPDAAGDRPHRVLAAVAGRRSVLDSRASVLRRTHEDAKSRFSDAPRAAAGPRRQGAGLVRQPVSAARHRDHARPAVQHRLPVRLDLSLRIVPARAGTARPGDRAARKGPRRDAGQVAILAGHRVRATTGTSTTTSRRRPPSSAAPTSPARRGGSSLWRRRRSARAAIAARRGCCGSRSPKPRTTTTHATPRARSCSSSMRSRRSNGCSSAVDALTAPNRRAGDRLERPDPVGDDPRHSARSGRRAVRAVVLIPGRAVARSRPCSRCPSSPERAAAPDGAQPAHRRRVRHAARADARQLHERLHLSPAPRPVAGAAALGLPVVRPHARLVRKHPGAELSGAAGPLPQVPHADLADLSDHRAASPARCFWPATCGTGRVRC